MDRRERLLTLTLTLLHTPRPLTAEELRDRVPGYGGIDQLSTFRRAFERDKEALREMGVPIEVQPIHFTDPPEEGYRIPAERYYLRDPELDPDELAALRLAATAVRVGELNGTEALLRLGGLEAGQDPEPAEPLVLPVPEGLEDLFAAVAEASRVGFTYRDRDRVVDPYRLDFLRGRWYLTGFDHDRGAERVYRVDRMSGLGAVGSPGAFEAPAQSRAGAPAQPLHFEVDEPTEAVLALDDVAAPWVRTELGDSASYSETSDGQVLARIQVTNRAAFRSFVLGMLDHAVLLEPEEMREDLIAWLEAIA